SQRFGFEEGGNPDDMVRQMRSFVAHRGLAADPGPWALWLLALVVLNPAGRWMTWTSMQIRRPIRILVSLLSLAWYAALAGLVLARLPQLEALAGRAHAAQPPPAHPPRPV